jgi:hypothetical protein
MNQFDFQSHLYYLQPWGFLAVDAGPIGFSSNVTTSHGPWSSPWIEAGRGAASATPDLSRIGQTSWIPIKGTLCS